MKKVLEAELVTMAHRILRMKDKDVDHLLVNAKSLYEKLLILKFYQDNFELGLIQDITKQELESKLEAHVTQTDSKVLNTKEPRHQMPQDLIEQDYPLVIELENDRQIDLSNLAMIQAVEKIAPEIIEDEFTNKAVEYDLKVSDSSAYLGSEDLDLSKKEVFDYLDTLESESELSSTDLQSEIVSLESESALSSTDLQSEIVSLESESALSSTDLQPELVSLESESALSSTDLQPELVSVESESELSSTDLQPEIVSVESESELSSTDLQPELASIELESELSSTDLQPELESFSEELVHGIPSEFSASELEDQAILEQLAKEDQERAILAELQKQSIDDSMSDVNILEAESNTAKDKDVLIVKQDNSEKLDTIIVPEAEVTAKESIDKREVDPFVGFNFMDLDFQRVNSENRQEFVDQDQDVISNQQDSAHPHQDQDQDKAKEQNTLFNLESTSVKQPHVIKSKSINDIYNAVITVGLNDRIAFEKNLFGGSSEDFNRVLSQLNTVSTFEEALSLIEHLVKPEYNNWEGKQEYEERFMQIVEKRFM
ncbi:hypothetical protein [Myroides sp. LJL119]